MSVSSADGLINYAFRRLGAPVIDINVDKQQAEERLDDALQFFAERHFDGVEKHYYKHKVTQSDIDNGFIDVSGLTAGSAGGYTGAPPGTSIVSVRKVMPFGSQTSNMFNVRYQMSLQDYFGINRNTHYGVALGLASYDRLLKEYVTSLIKRQWGSNLSKFDGVQLPGGITLRGAEIFSEANEEVRQIEERVLNEYELPVDFFLG